MDSNKIQTKIVDCEQILMVGTVKHTCDCLALGSIQASLVYKTCSQENKSKLQQKPSSFYYTQVLNNKSTNGARGMVQQVRKVLIANTDDLCFISGTQMVEG